MHRPLMNGCLMTDELWTQQQYGVREQQNTYKQIEIEMGRVIVDVSAVLKNAKVREQSRAEAAVLYQNKY